MQEPVVPNIIVITGAYPDIGKGTFTSSLAYLIKSHGYKVAPIKFDGYLNASSGTMNPYHGRLESAYSDEEVFVLENGYEGDADSGYYERFLHDTFMNESNISNGRLFGKLTQQEKDGKLRHGEVLNYRALRDLLEKWILDEARNNDFTFIEIGGTVGDKDSEILFDCLNLLKSRRKVRIFSLMLSPYFKKSSDIGTELSYRSKITRQAFEKSWRQGLMPDAIVMRASDKKIVKNDLEYLGLETGLNERKDVYIDPDLPTIYDLPDILERQGLSKRILAYFGRKTKKVAEKRIQQYAEKLRFIKEKPALNIAVFGKSVSDDSYVSLKEAIQHAGVGKGVMPQIVWLDDSENWKKTLMACSGLIVGESLRFTTEKLQAIQLARTKNIPTLAISFGCDLLIKEYFEHVLKKSFSIEELKEPPGEYAIYKSNMVVGKKELLTIPRIKHYSPTSFPERFRTNSKLGIEIARALDSSVLKSIIFSSNKDEVFGVEHSKHPFYVGVKFHPEFISHPMYPHPLFTKLFQVMIGK